ncbi:hypothetical protein A9977_13595 [Variovorax sp. UMC13]|nr:hypothetical protein [Variovorax sp. UMC13]
MRFAIALVGEGDADRRRPPVIAEQAINECLALEASVRQALMGRQDAYRLGEVPAAPVDKFDSDLD